MQKLHDLDDLQTFIFKYDLWERRYNIRDGIHVMCRMLAHVNLDGKLLYWYSQIRDQAMPADNDIQPVEVNCQ